MSDDNEVEVKIEAIADTAIAETPEDLKKRQDTNDFNGMPHDFSLKHFQECEACKTWVSLCVSEPDFSKDQEAAEKWAEEKEKFWVANKDHLTEKGFTQFSSYSKAIDFINFEKYKVKDLDQCLIIFKIGSDNRPSSPENIEEFTKQITEAIGDVKGVRIIITHNDIKLEKVSLLRLRELQSEVLKAKEENCPVLLDIDI